MSARAYGQYCGVVTALELVGERWALLIVRDLLVGPRRYTDLKRGLPRIPTNILSTRLKELQAGGVVRRVPLAHGLVYELTEFGRGLEEVVLALGRWGFRAMGAPEPGDVITPDSLTMALRTAFRAGSAAALPPTAYEAHVGDVVLGLDVADGALAVAPGPRPGADLVFAAGPAIRSVIAGEVAPAEAVERGIVRVLDGAPELLGRFAATFHLASEPAPAAA
ncbi:winged helix-turn-helix transcriptional regulator [Georgenia ruanii]|uniref:Transcriptional regulator n=1 Tax=Georgenia ruanii TaxID=348442 RepID=A0A7J9UYX1_9MICO|nr:helix-turn-helix domain-containing protein [Georgenia ruanii]MPV89090.1 transcriptional regulator [Georgenia ruanii]